jgi:asparagine N-glycosylation enzyme membrane subunit Stt3
MKPLVEAREARSPLQEGISLLPYIPIYQRMHRRRWGAALLASLAAGGLAWWWQRSQR